MIILFSARSIREAGERFKELRRLVDRPERVRAFARGPWCWWTDSSVPVDTRAGEGIELIRFDRVRATALVSGERLTVSPMFSSSPVAGQEWVEIRIFIEE